VKKKVLISAPKYYGIDTDIKEAFDVLDFRTILINNRTKLTYGERVANRLGIKFPLLKLILNPILKSYLIKENREFIINVNNEKPDLLFIIKGDHIFPATLEKLKKIISCPIIAYVWDDPFYATNTDQDDYRRTNFSDGIPWYDYIYVFDSFYIEEIKRKGAKKVQYLPLATNPNRYKEISVSEQDRRDYGYDVCFIGVPFESRVEIFEGLHDYNLGVFGDQWTKYFIRKGQKTPSYYKGRVSSEIVNKIYLSSKIVLNIHHPHSIEGLNTRTFDIPACGAFEIVDYKEGVEKHFVIDKEIVTFRSINELRSKIDFYLENEDLRKSIAERGKQRVLIEHTWVHRAIDIITALNVDQKVEHLNLP
jgi:spore maturation protein CgeB